MVADTLTHYHWLILRFIQNFKWILLLCTIFLIVFYFYESLLFFICLYTNNFLLSFHFNGSQKAVNCCSRFHGDCLHGDRNAFGVQPLCERKQRDFTWGRIEDNWFPAHKIGILSVLFFKICLTFNKQLNYT